MAALGRGVGGIRRRGTADGIFAGVPRVPDAVGEALASRGEGRRAISAPFSVESGTGPVARVGGVVTRRANPGGSVVPVGSGTMEFAPVPAAGGWWARAQTLAAAERVVVPFIAPVAAISRRHHGVSVYGVGWR